MSEILTVKQLAVALKVSANYVYEMRRGGFRMGRYATPAGHFYFGATVEEALAWITSQGFRKSTRWSKERQKQMIDMENKLTVENNGGPQYVLAWSRREFGAAGRNKTGKGRTRMPLNIVRQLCDELNEQYPHWHHYYVRAH